MSRVRVLVTVPRPLLEEISRSEDLERLEEFADVMYNETGRNLREEELAELIEEFDACVTSWGSPRFTEKVLEKANRLRIIGHAAGSVKPYVTDEVFKRGIVVVNAAAAIATGVAEFTLAMILNCLRGIPDLVAAMRRGDWSYRRKGRFTRDLRGKRVGLIGFGLVARELAKLLKPFNVKILVYDPHISRSIAGIYNVELVDLNTLLETCDVVSIHAALTEETRGMIGERELKMMRRDAYLVNTARGPIVDEDALIRALREGWIAGAALDVFEQEPLPRDHPLRELGNVYLTPHVAGPSDEGRRKLLGVIVEELQRFFSGKELRYKVEPEELRVRA
ncbi:MAG: hydroxyacid dehydrogenase [Thermoprotei archaeon]|nr:MAG: hydroxyacid dehydrogenase [Thermoprotei archaeon]